MQERQAGVEGAQWVMAAVMVGVMLLGGCSGAGQSRVGEEALTEQCQAKMEQCKGRCKQEGDVAAQSACLSSCMHEVRQCEGTR
jgi:outer membrane murein-binding lipoprotein Lpp